jgi:hypothetical protein
MKKEVIIGIAIGLFVLLAAYAISRLAPVSKSSVNVDIGSRPVATAKQ